MNTLKYYVSKCRIQSCQDISLNKIFGRNYGSKKASRQEKATLKALQHFDDFYKGIFKKQWHSIRLGLLSESKHVALINNFGDLEETEELLKHEGALDLRVFLKQDEPNLINIEKQESDQNLSGGYENTEIIEDIENKDLKVSYPIGCDDKFKALFKEDKSESDDDNCDASLKMCDADSDLSMSEALNKSQLDKSRLIDPSMGFTSLDDFIPVSQIRGQEEFVQETDYFRFFKVNSDFQVNVEKEQEVPFPEYLRVYSFPRGDVSSFPHPKPCSNGVYNYYPLDGAAILVILALDLKAGDRVLDLCAAPGGKSLAILQTMLPEYLVCNDSSISRCNRLLRVLKQYLYDYPDEWGNVSVTTIRGADYSSNHKFNKILVDVPCTTDRISATVDENNIFKSSRIRERLKLPECQSELLENALKLVEPGGTVVYSTCTLSPIQNDGVVSLALQKVWRNHQIEFTVRDLSPALNRLRNFYRFAPSKHQKYGSLVLPFVPANFGPMYFCKLVRSK